MSRYGLKKIILFIALILCIAFTGCNRTVFVREGQGLGNTAGNLMNYGLAASKNDWIFYSNSNMEHIGLYKERLDGTDKKKLLDEYCSFINISGDFLFFYIEGEHGIYRMPLEGGAPKRICDDLCYNVFVNDKEIFYINFSDGEKLYRINSDGSQKVRLTQYAISYINIAGEWIYYCKNISNRQVANPIEGQPYGTIYRIRTNGSGEQQISKIAARFINVQGDWIYFCDMDNNRRLCMVKTDGTGKMELTKEPCGHLNAAEDWIYYTSGSGYNNIYRIKTDGSCKTKLNEYGKCVNLNVAGNSIFFDYYYHGKGERVRMNLGTKQTEMAGQ